MMPSDNEKFRRLKREHARLHTPVARKSSVELIPLEGKRRARVGATLKPEESIKEKKSETASPDLPPVVASASQGTEKGEPDNPTALTADPAVINCSIDLFQDRTFELVAPSAEQVALLWRKPSGSEPSRVVMDAQRENRFDTTITIDDGEYIFGYEIDGRMRPDPCYAQRLLLCGRGIFARLKLERYAYLLTLHSSEESDLVVGLDSDAAWLVPETNLLIAAGRTMTTKLRLLPTEMVQGMNSATLHVNARKAADEAAQLAQTIHIEVVAGCMGVLPELIYSPSSFGPIMQGKEDAHLTVEVRARGRGTLHGMIALAHSGEMIDLRLETEPSGPVKFTHHFTIDSLNLPCRDEGQVKIKLITDSYLSNRRLYQADIPYSLIYLKKSLPVLSFGKLISDSNKTVRLEVNRSDGQEVEIHASIPESIAPHLEFYEARSGVYLFRFSAERLSPGTIVNEEVILQDSRSGLQTRIKLMAEIIAHHVAALQEVSR
jgi:hypothetical protein